MLKHIPCIKTSLDIYNCNSTLRLIHVASEPTVHNNCALPINTLYSYTIYSICVLQQLKKKNS